MAIDSITFSRTVSGARRTWGLPAVNVGPSISGPDWTAAAGTINAIGTSLSNLLNTTGVAVAASVSLTASRWVRAESKTAGFTLGARQATPTWGIAHLEWAIPSTVFTGGGVTSFSWLWQWQWSADGVTWTDIDRTSHEIFIGIGEPTLPWECSGAAKTMCPPTEVMRLACEWAAGASTPTGVSDKMAFGMFGLGGQLVGAPPTTIAYNPSANIFGAAGGFNVYDFVDFARLKDMGVYSFNCADAANAVATLATAVGASLSIVRVWPKSAKLLYTNEYWGVGDSKPSRPTSFEQHVFAATTLPSGNAGSAWEASFRLDLDGDPANLKNTHRDWQRVEGLAVADYLPTVLAPKTSWTMQPPAPVDLDERPDWSPPQLSTKIRTLLEQILPGWSDEPDEMAEKSMTDRLDASISQSLVRTLRVTRSGGVNLTRVTGRMAQSGSVTPVLQYWQAPNAASAREFFTQLLANGLRPFSALRVSGPRAAAVSTQDGADIVALTNRLVIRVIETDAARALGRLQSSTTFVVTA